jgi:hypothetical protein
MDSLTKSFEMILGRKATAQESQDAFRIINAAGVSENDSFAILLLMSQAYMINYGSIPQAIEKEAAKILERFRITAKVEAEKELASAKADLARAVATSAKEVARKVTDKEYFKWGTTALGMAFIVCIGSIWAGYQLGYKGRSDQLITEQAIASWANTEDGKKAFKLWQAGNMHGLATCSIKGWKEEGNTCFPTAVTEGKVSNMYGYQLRR